MDNRKGRSNLWLVALLIALPIVLLIGREFFVGETIGNIRTVDAADIFILTPVYIGLLLYLLQFMSVAGASTKLLLAFLVFAFLFIFSQGMHSTANSINTFSTEVRDYESILPKDLYSLVFFLDEQLSHLLVFTAVTGLMACWFIFDRSAIAQPLIPYLPLLIVTIGIIYGITQAYAVIEARLMWIEIPMVLTLMGLWVWYWRKSQMNYWRFLNSRPFTTFVAVMSLTTVIATVLYSLYFGGFPQPSEFVLPGRY